MEGRTADRRVQAPSEQEIRSYVMERFAQVKRSNRIGNLVAFQAANKYMIMARDQEELKALGNIVAGYKKNIAETIAEYETHLQRALSREPTTKTHSNVIQHVFGYFARRLGDAERQRFLGLLSEFRDGRCTIGRTLAEMAPVIYRFNNTYLASQTYFLLYSDPGPGRALLPR